jgi:hypothetical protein
MPIPESHTAIIFTGLDQTMLAVIRGTIVTALAQD